MSDFYPLALVAVIALVVLVVYLIMTLLQLQRTLKRVDTLLDNTERELIPLLVNMRQVSEQLKESTDYLKSGIHQAWHLLEVIGETAESIQNMRHNFSRYFHRALAAFAGFKMLGRFFKPQHAEEGD